MWPTRALAKRKMRLVIPPVFMRFPARMKKGTASRVKPGGPGIHALGQHGQQVALAQAHEEAHGGQPHGHGDGQVQEDQHEQDQEDGQR